MSENSKKNIYHNVLENQGDVFKLPTSSEKIKDTCFSVTSQRKATNPHIREAGIRKGFSFWPEKLIN